MEIKTKFDVGDYCLALHDSEVKRFKVVRVLFSEVALPNKLPSVIYELSVDSDNDVLLGTTIKLWEYQCHTDLNEVCEYLKRTYGKFI